LRPRGGEVSDGRAQRTILQLPGGPWRVSYVPGGEPGKGVQTQRRRRRKYVHLGAAAARWHVDHRGSRLCDAGDAAPASAARSWDLLPVYPFLYTAVSAGHREYRALRQGSIAQPSGLTAVLVMERPRRPGTAVTTPRATREEQQA